MFWTIVRIIIAIGAAVVFYWIAATVLRMIISAPPPDAGPGDVRAVDIRFECTVCGSQVTMTAAPGGDVPAAPLHCMEEMQLVADHRSE